VNITPNSLGNKNDNNISIKYRGIHPSYIGRIDINVCGNSDPGTSGIITPFCKTDGLFFDDSYEPEEFKFQFEKDVNDYRKKNSNNLFIDIDCDNITDYFKQQEKFREVINKMEIKEIEHENLDRYYIKINIDNDDEEI